MLHTISIAQALALWAELEDAFNGRNSHGSQTAEIYAHSLWPHSPSIGKIGAEAALSSPIIGEYSKKIIDDGAKALVQLISIFASKRNCTVKIDDLSPETWLEDKEPFLHRCHVKVIRSDENER